MNCVHLEQRKFHDILVKCQNFSTESVSETFMFGLREYETAYMHPRVCFRVSNDWA